MKIEKYRNPSVYTFLFPLNNSLNNKSIDCNALKLLNLKAQPLHDLYDCSISSKESFPLSKSLLFYIHKCLLNKFLIKTDGNEL